jgi:type IV pilus assembly protein PilA
VSFVYPAQRGRRRKSMFIAIRERLERGREEGGFTLIELMVVVLIIAILIAIAIPTFLGARRRAQDKQAQSNLRNALTAEKTFYVDNQAYTDDNGVLGGLESALQWGNQDASVRGVEVAGLFLLEVADDSVVLRSDSKSGQIFCLADVAAGGNAGTYYANAPAVDDACPDAADGMAGWDADAGVGWRY